MKPASVLLVCLLFAVIGITAQDQPKVTGFFSDMHYVPQAGVLGTEVWIVYAGNGYWATVQVASGEPNTPVVVPVDVSGSKIKFTVRISRRPNPDEVLTYTGAVTRFGLELSIAGTTETLSRSNSYWQSAP
jgi:hypothetical protein